MHMSHKIQITHYLAPPPLWYGGMSALLGDARTKWALNQLTKNIHVEATALKRQVYKKKAERKEKRRRARSLYRNVRQRWKTLAKIPTKLTLAQERTLADTHLEDMQTKHCNLHQPDESLKTTEKALKIATFNVKGLNFASGRQQLMYLVTKHNVDIVALQTHVNYTGKEEHGDFLFYFSSIIEDEHRKKADLKLEELSQKVKKKWITAQEAKRER